MSNCFLYALGRFAREGGYLVLRKSHFGWWPHLLWSKDLRSFEQFVPIAARRRLIPPLLFRGSVKIGEDS
jgi:hypothetical protein